MKEYHTKIEIDRPIQEVWNFLINFDKYPDWNPLVGRLSGDFQEGGTIEVYIIPLKKSFFPTLTSLIPEKEIVWKGVQGAAFILAGTHYYRLNALGDQGTELEHGETFTGILSNLLPKKMLANMEQVFKDHNQALKNVMENEMA